MPIYAYQCGACGFAKDVLQKISDAPLTQCPICGQSAFTKQVTAAGFQLKGSGWYATDFKNSGAVPTAAKTAGNTAAKSGGASSGSEPSTGGDASAGGDAPAPVGACGGNCACH